MSVKPAGAPNDDRVAPRHGAAGPLSADGGAPPRPLPLRRFLLTFVRNPLSSLPRPVYEEPIVVHDNGHNVIAWVTDPALVEQVLLHGNARSSPRRRWRSGCSRTRWARAS